MSVEQTGGITTIVKVEAVKTQLPPPCLPVALLRSTVIRGRPRAIK